MKKPDKRNLPNPNDVRFELCSRTDVALVLRGSRPDHTDVIFRAEIPWDWIPSIMKDLRKIWDDEKNKRLELVERIDEAILPKEEAPF